MVWNVSMRSSSFLFLLGINLVATGTLFADTVSPNLRVETTIGWNGLVKHATWNPIVVEVENTGARDDFILVVEVKSGTSRTVGRNLSFREHFELSGGDRKRFDFAVPIESIGLPVVVSILQNGAERYKAEHSILGRSIRVPLVVALSRSTAFDFLIPESMVAYVHPELLPMRWDAYLGVDLLILHDAEWRNINTAQIEAIEAWVDIGGRTIIVGGPHLKSVDRSIRTLVPFDVAGVFQSDSEISTHLGLDMPILDNSLLSRITRIDQGVSVLASSGVAPVLVYHSRGAGKIVAFAFDFTTIPMSEWTGRDELWRVIIGEDAIRSDLSIAPQADGDSEPAVTSLVNEMDTGASGRLIYLFFMVAYVATVFVAIGYIGASPRSLLRWGAITIVLGVSTIGARFVFATTLYRRNYLVGSATLAEYRPGARFARSTTHLVVVSSSINRNEITFERDRSIVLPRSREALVLDRIDGDLVFTTRHETPWSNDSFTIDTIMPLDLSAMRNDDADSIHIEITNTTRHLLSSGTLIYRGSIRPTGPLAPGERFSERLERSNEEAVTNLADYRRRYGSLHPTREATVVDMLADDRWRSLLEGDAVLYLGWVNAPLIELETAESFRFYTSTNLIVVVLEADIIDV